MYVCWGGFWPLSVCLSGGRIIAQGVEPRVPWGGSQLLLSMPPHNGVLHWGILIFPISCMLLAACLLAAKPGRSTLDTKKGCKTKTGSTSSVTLIKTEYWDRAGGGRNIRYEW